MTDLATEIVKDLLGTNKKKKKKKRKKRKKGSLKRFAKKLGTAKVI